jgi:hypothetical protein
METMSKGTKIFLIVLITLLVLCVCGCAATVLLFTYGGGQFLENAVIEDPQAAQDLADSMFEYTVPPGYSEEMAMNMGIMKMVMIMPENNNGGQIIMLMQLPGIMTADPAIYQQQMQQQMQRQFGGESTMSLVETDSVTIRGQQVELMYFEGTSSELGVLTRMMVSSFIKGDSGQIMVMIMGASTNWDQLMVDNFLQSIR